MAQGLWIFGYGSLVWRPAFEFSERRTAWLGGFERRFWQASPDHRGTAEAPGRVATLVPAPSKRVGGVAYRVPAERQQQVLDYLDVREIAGYVREQRALELGHRVVEKTGALHSEPVPEEHVPGLVYIATSANPNYVGPAPEAEIARIAARRRGPSGDNRDYVLRLHRALAALGLVDEHVAAITAHLQGLEESEAP